MKQNNSFYKNDSGATAVEFSLIAIVFLTIIFGIIEAGRICWTQAALQYAVEEASRMALVDNDMTEGEIEAAALDSLQSMMVPAAGFNAVAVYEVGGDFDYVEIDATYQYTAMITALLPAGMAAFELEAKARRPLVWEE